MSEVPTALLEQIDEPSVATDIRAMLHVYRARGYPFDEAWKQCLLSLPRNGGDMEEWRLLLRRSRPFWKVAYERAS